MTGALRRQRRQRWRRQNFDFPAKRRREIVAHALHVGAAETEDFRRWLVAWVWHNPKAKDQIWSLMECAKNMGGKISEAEASEITEEASIIRKCWSADNLARFLGVTYAQRQALGLTTVGSVNVGRQARKELRKRADRLYQERRRRERGARPHSESLSQSKPWRAEGMSRAKWYRQRTMRRETDSSATIFLSGDDEVVSGTSKKMEFKQPSAAKKERGYPSSQTANKSVADSYGSSPLELRLLALGLSIPKKLARAA
jgi:hypothetical protein